MVREVITVNVGQCGIQLGQSVWEQYCAEHEIYADGKKETVSDDDYFLTFYDETSKGRYVPRNLMVDLEPTVIDNVKSSKYSSLFSSEFLLSGLEDAGNNFARGHYTVGKEMIDKVDDRLRKLVENCDYVWCFMMNHSVGGYDQNNFFVEIDDFDPDEDKYLSYYTAFRGSGKAKEAYATVQWLRRNKKIAYAEWATGPSSTRLAKKNYAVLEDEHLCTSEKSAAMFGNNPAICRFFSERISKRFDLMYSQRAFVHWYVADAMEEGEFVEARENLRHLEQDYLEFAEYGKETDEYDESLD